VNDHENALRSVSSPSIEREDIILKLNEYLYLKLGFPAESTLTSKILIKNKILLI
jgi:hypothetical protein